MFLKWGAKAFENMLIVPPGSGIVHQVNLEYLARVVFDSNELLYPDSVVGTDSHTTMINGLGILGWGVGGIEAEAVMLGQAISMLLPKVVGYKLVGKMNQYVTSTDLVLTVTKVPFSCSSFYFLVSIHNPLFFYWTCKFVLFSRTFDNWGSLENSLNFTDPV